MSQIRKRKQNIILVDESIMFGNKQIDIRPPSDENYKWFWDWWNNIRVPKEFRHSEMFCARKGRIESCEK